MMLMTMMKLLTLLLFSLGSMATALSLRPASSSLSSSFHGLCLMTTTETTTTNHNHNCNNNNHRAQLYMRKQKASDKRTRRRQRGEVVDESSPLLSSAVLAAAKSSSSTLTTSPMKAQGASWKQKNTAGAAVRSAIQSNSKSTEAAAATTGGGRGRSRKRSMLYTSLSFYHNKFMQLLQAEYKAEEDEVLGRIKASLDDPISLEVAGYALFDMEASRRGNLFSDEVYRLAKAPDATTVYSRSTEKTRQQSSSPKKGSPKTSTCLPENHKFRPNDVILLTLQPNGSGDFFDATTTSPLSEEATQMEARVLNVGPTYVDIATQAGKFASILGPAPNENNNGGQFGPSSSSSNKKSTKQRLRVDRFFSSIPYERMVTALKQLSQIPDRTAAEKAKETSSGVASDDSGETTQNPLSRIRMDTVLSDVILSTHAFADPESPLLRDAGVCDLDEMARRIGKAPMPASAKLAQQALRYMLARPGVFRELNGPQLAAIEAALTRRLTLIQGPPGTGKTAIGAAIGFGMVHQCRSISADSAKVMACAFSNVGADNLAQALKGVGLEVLRIGKPSAVTQSLWNSTLDAAIDRDPDARAALDVAARVTARLNKIKNMDKTDERLLRQQATNAVKAAQAACLVAATRAMRKADVIVSTSTGAADPRLMAACGIQTGGEEEEETSSRKQFSKLDDTTNSAADRTMAPDGLPPLSLPFVIVDEACQSVEPATLIPLVSSDSCRSLVLLGDPCQLPPTVRIDVDSTSPLSVSLMERLASALPAPHSRSQNDITPKDTSYLGTFAMKQARSLLHSLEKNDEYGTAGSYRKRYAGSLLLSIQYRMHPSIAALPSAIFYDGMLTTPDFMKDIRHFPDSLQQMMPCEKDTNLCVRVVNVGGRNNERRGSLSSVSTTSFGGSTAAIEEQTSFLNTPEAKKVVSLLGEMLATNDSSIRSIGIISPYTAQVQLIKSLIADHKSIHKQLASRDIELEVKSVDGYQGRERDVIIFSAVRSNRQGKIGFLQDWRRMNVALTRAKNALVVVGDLETLSFDKNWAVFCKWAVGAGCVLENEELS